MYRLPHSSQDLRHADTSKVLREIALHDMVIDNYLLTQTYSDAEGMMWLEAGIWHSIEGTVARDFQPLGFFMNEPN